MKIVMGLALTASLVAFGGARAQTPNELVYDWTLTGPTTGAGTITVNDYGDPNLGLDILAIGGTFDGAAINGLLGTNGFQYSPSGQFQIDNLLYTNDASAYLDVYGVLFSTDAYQEVNIWGNGGGDYAAYSWNPGGYVLQNATGEIFSITFDQYIPEPSSVALAGIGLLGLAMARRTRAVAKQ